MSNPQNPVAVFEIKEYMVIWRQVEKRVFNGIETKVRAMVRCTGEEYTMDVFFLAEDSAFPDPQIDLANKRGSLFMPAGDLMAFVDVLRNEHPIFGHLRADKPEWTSITTTAEPVGEGDTK